MEDYNDLIQENAKLKKELQKFTDSMLLKERFLKNVLAFPGIICECDENLNLLFLNKLGLSEFEVKEEEVIGNSVLNYIEPKDQQRLVTHAKAIFKGDYGVPKIYRAVSSKGKTFDIIVSSAPVITKDQSIRIRSTIIKCEKEKDERKESIFQASTYAIDDIYSSMNNVVKKDMDNIKPYEMVIQSMKMRDVLSFVNKVKNVTSSVLITGESGTGKELVARQIHDLGIRKKEPFVAINCGALPENLLESELFGYEAGAFTGANKKKKGKFELAEGGTIFLDEIGDMSLSMQVKLLRVLQDKTITPLGSEKSKVVDTRILLATNRDLDNMVKTGDFRGDLYYRIKSFHISLPSLNERVEEIEYLCSFFINKFNRLFNKDVSCVSSQVLELFQNYEFPGNVRELQHLLEYGTIFCKSNEITIEDLPVEFIETTKNVKVKSSNETDADKLQKELDEKEMIISTIIKSGGNKTLAAERMGMHKTTLYRKLKQYNITDDQLIGKI